MMDILTGINTRATLQSEKASPEQVKNSAGGFVFQISDEERLRRFLILGTDGGTYYISAKDLTKDNAGVVIKMAQEDPVTLLKVITDVSLRGAAPKQNATIFALAIACSFGDEDHRKAALAAIPLVCRTGTHLFLFARYIEQFRGWGRGLRRAVSSWYLDKEAKDVAFQAVKYRQREGWSHRDLLRLSHPMTVDPAMKATFEWITKQTTSLDTPLIIEAFIKANQPETSLVDIASLVDSYGLTWEMLPDHALASVDVWESLLTNNMGMTALIRQLPRLTRLGMLPVMGGWTNNVVDRLTDMNSLQKARIHPINLLTAHKTYGSGHSERGTSTWSPTPKIVDALDSAFYASFGTIEPANKRTLLAIDVSTSMTWHPTAASLTPREASAAMALVTMATEPEVGVVGFMGGRSGFGYGGYSSGLGSDGIDVLKISPRQRMGDVLKSMEGLPFGSTDCALPMIWAQKQKLQIDTFVVYTDNETWAGDIHPHQALRKYREWSGINSKLVVVGMEANDFSIADPKDPGMMDVVGFDPAVPQLITQFSRGL